MTSVVEVVRSRRRHRKRTAAAQRWRTAALASITLASLLAGAAILSVGSVLFEVAAGLPGAAALPSFFGDPGQERLRPSQLFDRTGEVLLAEVVHPLASQRRWLKVEDLPPAVVQATVAALDPSFETHGGVDPARAFRIVAGELSGRRLDLPPQTLAERLADQMVDSGYRHASLARLLLAADIGTSAPRERVLEWFINSADYGHLAFGLDGAALVYLGKHAEELTLGEAALLAALPGSGGFDLFEDETLATALRREVLEAMRRQGRISAEQAEAAGREPIILQSAGARHALEGLGFVEQVWLELKGRVGAGPASQAGLRVVTTLDLDLQLQVDCLARSQLARMSGGQASAALPAADGSHCVAASLLPPVRPSDVGIDHGARQVAVVVLDPTAGEVLALTGPAIEAQPAGGILDPLVYLSAFSRGFTPSTMVIDEGEGPVRLRTALTGRSGSVSDQLAGRLGFEVVARTLDQMGIDPPAGLGPIVDGTMAVAPADLAQGMGILANRGVLAGVTSPSANGLTATTIAEIYTADGRLIYSARSDRRAILSEGLAYLVNDILSEAAGAGGLPEIGRPAAIVVAEGEREEVSWAVGYTPQRVVAAWVAPEAGGRLIGVHALNGAAPIGQAAMRYAVGDLPVEDWSRPIDVTEVEVCDPSGYLPTAYCPRVVRDVFLLGTEPTHPDSLYRPFRVNPETGRLATFFTPLDQVEERIYFVPPPEAEAWARQAGYEPPPDEYDRVPAPEAPNPEVHLSAPGFLSAVSGRVPVRGAAAGDGFESYRLDAGQGLNPTAWLQIGAVGEAPVVEGLLGTWDTADLNGAYILRLTVVRTDGTVDLAAVPLTVDNEAPTVEVILPVEGSTFRLGQTVAIQVDAADDTGVRRVVIYVDGRPVADLSEPPWSVRWAAEAAGEHRLLARAYDGAGNSKATSQISILVER